MVGAGLLGRRAERTRLEALVDDLRAGRSGVLIVRGEPGIGKSALLKELAEAASGLRTLWAVGVESEMELAFAGLHQLCAPLFDRLEELPEPQRHALETVFGVREGAPPDRFLVGLATLSLLCEAAERQPIVCVVDDAQWLDRASAQTLAFVGRRLLADPVGLVFSTREPADELAGLPELVLGGLRDADARTLLGSVPGAPLDEQVRERILRETRGNPLGLLEWHRALTPAELSGGFAHPATAASLSRRIEEGFRRQIAQLPVGTRRFLLVAAAEPVGDPELVWRAARRLGVESDDAAPAIDAGLVEVGASVRFHHPLVRSAAYQSASAADQQLAHRALAEVTDLDADPDRRAWHRARATRGPDEDVASELERAARRAEARGGLAAAGAFLERSVALTADPSRRIDRALAAAEAFQQSGRLEAATRLVASAEAIAVDDVARSEVALLRGRIAYAAGDGGDAPRLLFQAAQQLELVDADRARQTYLTAIIFACFAGNFADGVDMVQIATTARAAPRADRSSQALDLLFDGFSSLAIDGPGVAAPLLKRAIAVFRGRDTASEDLRWLGAACPAASVVWDDERWNTLVSEYVAFVRKAGALTYLSSSLNGLAHSLLLEGDLEAASSHINEAAAINEVSGSRYAPYTATYLAALRGKEIEATRLVERTIEEATANGQGVACQFARLASATLWNGLGRYDEALAAALQAREHPPDWSSNLSLHELIEAAVRCREHGIANEALEQLVESTSASGTDWALGIEARSRALIADGEDADALYREALERLSRTRVRTELARAHLLYGEWLRRDNRRVDAREQLRIAHEMFNLMGIAGFAERARRELQATGEVVRKRNVETFDELTAQEACIARLAVDGLTNPEIGVQLYISARTVEYHLHKIFTKLGVASRRELRGVLPVLERH